jgi:hypothetical protein
MISVVLAASLVAAGPADLRTQPPPRLQKPIVANVWFADADDVSAWCHESPGSASACTVFDGRGKATIILPNPCHSSSDWGLLLCHEIGHAHGWPGDHRGGHLVPPAPHREVIAGTPGVAWRLDTALRHVSAWCATSLQTGSCLDGGEGPDRPPGRAPNRPR